MMQMHVEPPPIPLIKLNRDWKSQKDFLKPKLNRDPTASTSNLYEFKIIIFNNGDQEEFFFSCITSTQPSLC